jgi:hypothetical protein
VYQSDQVPQQNQAYLTRNSQNTDMTGKFMSKGDGTGGAAPATLQNRSAGSDQNDTEEDAGSGTIRRVLAKQETGLKSSENSGSVPKTSGVFERESHERSDSVVKVSSREA